MTGSRHNIINFGAVICMLLSCGGDKIEIIKRKNDFFLTLLFYNLCLTGLCSGVLKSNI